MALGNSVGTGVGSPATKVGDTVGKPDGRALTGAAVKGGAVSLVGKKDNDGTAEGFEDGITVGCVVDSADGYAVVGT